MSIVSWKRDITDGLRKLQIKRENNIEYSAVKVVDGESKNYDVIYKRIFDDKNNFICVILYLMIRPKI